MEINATADSGHYKVTAWDMDISIETYLPNSIAGLRKIINERVTGSEDGDRTYKCRATTVTACLIILTDLDNDVNKTADGS